MEQQELHASLEARLEVKRFVKDPQIKTGRGVY